MTWAVAGVRRACGLGLIVLSFLCLIEVDVCSAESSQDLRAVVSLQLLQRRNTLGKTNVSNVEATHTNLTNDNETHWLDSTHVGPLGVVRAGYDDDWVKEYKQDPNATPRPPPTVRLDHGPRTGKGRPHARIWAKAQEVATAIATQSDLLASWRQETQSRIRLEEAESRKADYEEIMAGAQKALDAARAKLAEVDKVYQEALAHESKLKDYLNKLGVQKAMEAAEAKLSDADMVCNEAFAHQNEREDYFSKVWSLLPVITFVVFCVGKVIHGHVVQNLGIGGLRLLGAHWVRIPTECEQKQARAAAKIQALGRGYLVRQWYVKEVPRNSRRRRESEQDHGDEIASFESATSGLSLHPPVMHAPLDDRRLLTRLFSCCRWCR